jgi:hypothetical protein
MRKLNWLIPLVVLISLVSYLYVWPWYGERTDTATIESLTAELKAASEEIDQAIQEAPEVPRKSDLERFAQLNKQSQDLLPRLKGIATRLKGEVGEQFQEAQNHYLKRIDHMASKLNAMKKALDEGKAK